VICIPPKQPRLRLDPISYEQLRNKVLRRDSWRCQACGSMSSLEVHHKEFRSHSGDDSEENLITLCTTCHCGVHRVRRVFNDTML
jgi:5-methylcytosine-specific restriction endonuclease McrA